jgi:acyl carrier protein
MTTSPEVSAPGIRQSVIDVVGIILGRDGVDPSIDLFDQGVTSLAFIRIVAALNEKYDVALGVTELEEASIDALSALVETQLQENH